MSSQENGVHPSTRRIWGNHPVMMPANDLQVNIQMSPLTLLKDDETLVLQYSDFDILNNYLLAVRNSPLDDQIARAYDVLANHDGVTFEGKWHAFAVDQPKAELLSFLQDARNQYGGLVNICNTLIATAPLVPTLCSGIKTLSTHAITNYGQLFDDLMALKADPSKDDARGDASSILAQSHSMIGQLRDNSQNITNALTSFDGDSRAKESDLLRSLSEIEKRSGPFTHHWSIDENRDANTTHNHGFVTEQLRNEISSLNDKWQTAVQSVERLQGGCLAIQDDLGNIDKALNRPELFTEGKVVLRIDRDSIVRKWKAVGAEVDKLIGNSGAGRIYGYTTPR